LDYLWIALSVFVIVRFLQIWIEAPEWLWLLLVVGAASLSLLPWNQSWIHWYSPFAIAGIVIFAQRIENILIVKADEALTTVMRATARRPR
jgi:hypothetical protein